MAAAGETFKKKGKKKEKKKVEEREFSCFPSTDRPDPLMTEEDRDFWEECELAK